MLIVRDKKLYFFKKSTNSKFFDPDSELIAS